MFSWTIYLWIGVHISSIIHEYMVAYIVGSIFYINNNINNIIIMKEEVIILEFYIDAL